MKEYTKRFPVNCFYLKKYNDKMNNVNFCFEVYRGTRSSDNTEYLCLYSPINNLPTKKTMTTNERLDLFIKIYYRKFAK